eukprot:272088_1
MDKETMKYMITQLFYTHQKEDIFNAIKNVNARLAWHTNSFCSIYSRSVNKWFEGHITKIIFETGEWLIIKYSNGKTKKIQRFCSDIQPINYEHNINPNVQKIIKFISNKLSNKPITTNCEQKLNISEIYGDNRLMTLHTNKERDISTKFAMVTDLDNTLFCSSPNLTEFEYKTANEYVQEFNNIWCDQYAKNSVLIYATGRNLEQYISAVNRWDILKPDILVSKDGVCIHWFKNDDSVRATDECIWEDREWNAHLLQGWNQTFAEQIYEEVMDKYGDKLLKWPRNACVEQLRVGVLCKGQVLAKAISEYYVQRIEEYNTQNMNETGFVRMKIHTFECIESKKYQNNGYTPYWSAFTTTNAGKGSAIEYLRKRLNLRKSDIVCMGDSGNDISMLIAGYNSVVMANASEELIEFYEQHCENENVNMLKTINPYTVYLLILSPSHIITLLILSLF